MSLAALLALGMRAASGKDIIETAGENTVYLLCSNLDWNGVECPSMEKRASESRAYPANMV